MVVTAFRRNPVRRWMARMGQLRPRRQPRLNDRSRFSEETFAGAYVNGREAP